MKAQIKILYSLILILLIAVNCNGQPKSQIVAKINNEVVNDTSVVAIITERLPYNKQFTIIVKNLKDKAGNLIKDKNSAQFYFNGMNNQLNKPGILIKKQ